MKTIALAILILGIANCTSSPPKQNTHEIVKNMLDEEKYEEVSSFALKQNQPLQQQILASVENQKKCIELIRRCEVEGLSPQDNIECRNNLAESCSQYSWTNKFHLQGKYLRNKLFTDAQNNQEKQENLKREIQEKRQNIRNEIASRCDDGMRWGYYEGAPKSCFNCISPKSMLKVIHGEYQNQEDCEAARALASDKSKARLLDCTKRYVKDSLQIEFWAVKALIVPKYSMDSYQSPNIHFTNADKCLNAEVNGIEFQGTINDFSIQGSSAKSGNRFVSKCIKINHTVCKKNASEPSLPSWLIE